MAMISPALESFQESLSTLKFANRAKSITNQPQINEDLDQVRGFRVQGLGNHPPNQPQMNENLEPGMCVCDFCLIGMGCWHKVHS